jgi:hypothetical protein
VTCGFEERIVAYLLGDTGPIEELMNHLQRCPPCQKSYKVVEKIFKILESYPKLSLTEKTKTRFHEKLERLPDIKLIKT